jgi:uridylate kinase
LPSLCELYTVEAAQKYLNQGAVLLCVGGTGLPYFSTDTSAVIRACELRCDALFKGTKVRGIFEQDPVLQPQADFISVITHQEFLNKKLKVMDETAVSIAMKNNLTLRLFCLYEDQALVRVCDGTLNHSVIRTEQ